MANLFFRTNITPYRIDTYNALHEKLGCEMYFYWDVEHSQEMDMRALERLCHFTPKILKGFEIKTGKKRRKICTEAWKIIKENNPSFAIVPEFQILTLQVLLYKFTHRKKFKVISMCDDSYDMIVNNNDFSLIHKLARKIVTPLLDDLLLVDSRTVDWYHNYFGKGIWLPIIRDEKKEEVRYQDLLPVSNQLRERYNLVNKKVVLFVGRLVDLKNVATLIEAFGKMKEDAVLVIVGNGKEELNLKKQSASLQKDVIFTGHLEGNELYAWYNVGDVFCLPSYLEPYGAVTNEALLAGCRVVISEKAGSACLVNKNNGEIIAPMDIEAMADALDRQLKLIRKRDGNIEYRKNLMTVKFDERINSLKEILKGHH